MQAPDCVGQIERAVEQPLQVAPPRHCRQRHAAASQGGARPSVNSWRAASSSARHQRYDVRRRHDRPCRQGRARRADRLQGRDQATKASQRAGIEHAKGRADSPYLGRKPAFTRAQFAAVRDHGRIVDVSGQCPGFATLPSFNKGAVDRNATLSKVLFEREAEISRRSSMGRFRRQRPYETNSRKCVGCGFCPTTQRNTSIAIMIGLIF
jgi:hypothetical protein